MTKEAFDRWTVYHFVFGVLSHILVRDTFNVSTLVNFMIGNGLHLLMEFIELKIRNGVYENLNINNITDIIAFTLGWILSYKLLKIKIDHKYLGILWTIVIGTSIEEIYYEH